MAKMMTQPDYCAPQPALAGEQRLVTAPNPHPGSPSVERFVAPVFTSLCPVTGQPDFAHFVIDYVPNLSIVDTGSLARHLDSLRDHEGFHEDCTIAIGKQVAAAIAPKYLRIAAYWYPRGGIPIDVFWQTGELPAGVVLPDTGVAPYRGRR